MGFRSRTAWLCIIAFLLAALILPQHMARGGEFEDMSAAWSRAKTYYVKGDYTDAVKYYEYALALADRVDGPNAAETGKLVNNVAVCYQDLGQYGKAEPFFRRAVQIATATGDRVGVGYALDGLGVNYYLAGNLEQAEHFHLEALKVDEAVMGPNDLEIALVLNNLALLYVDRAEYTKAEPLYQRLENPHHDGGRRLGSRRGNADQPGDDVQRHGSVSPGFVLLRTGPQDPRGPTRSNPLSFGEHDHGHGQHVSSDGAIRQSPASVGTRFGHL